MRYVSRKASAVSLEDRDWVSLILSNVRRIVQRKFFEEPIWKLKENSLAKLKTFINDIWNEQQDCVTHSPRKGRRNSGALPRLFVNTIGDQVMKPGIRTRLDKTLVLPARDPFHRLTVLLRRLEHSRQLAGCRCQSPSIGYQEITQDSVLSK